MFCVCGYTLVDESATFTSVCQADGSWSATEASCEPVDCGEPTVLPNSTYSGAGTLYGDSVTYICEFGFDEVGGDNESVCGEDGNWLGSPLECEAWNCAIPTTPDHGSVAYTTITLNSSATFSCDPGYGLVYLFQPRLDDLSVPPISATSATCSIEREWRTYDDLLAALFICELITCPPVPIVNDTEILAGNEDIYVVNSTVEFNCTQGYRMRGKFPVIVCQEDGTWTQPFFECLSVDCGLPASVEHAAMALDEGTGEGATVVFTCDEGYTNSSRTLTRSCGQDGLWSTDFVECVVESATFCPDVPEVEHATVDVDSALEDGVAIYTCDQGYQHMSTNTYVCMESHEGLLVWQGYPGVECRPVDCGEPPVVKGATADYTSTAYNDKVFYTCVSGVMLSAENSKSCTATRKWSTEPVIECDSGHHCSTPPPLLNFDVSYNGTAVGDVATYQCRAGFVESTLESTCEADQTWALPDSYSECVPVECGSPPAVTHASKVHISGTTVGEMAVYECYEGYQHTGPSLRICETGGVWSSELIQCLPESRVFCKDPPPTVLHSNMYYSSRAQDSQASYTCATGYHGSAVVSVCGANGIWQLPSQLCRAYKCGAPTAVPLAVMVPSSPPRRFGTSVVYLCNVGYTPIPWTILTSTCQESRNWSPVQGSCQNAVVDSSTTCPVKPPTVPNAELSLVTAANYVGSFATYACTLGYSSEIPREVLAHSCRPQGTWSTELLSCRLGPCSNNIPNVTNAEMVELAVSNTDTEVLEAGFDCETGYTIDTQAPEPGVNTRITLTCSLNGQWVNSGNKQCRRVYCGEIPLPDGWKTVSNSHTTNYESRVELECRPPWYQNVSDSLLQSVTECSANGTWDMASVTLRCAPCDQEQDGAGIPDGYITLNKIFYETYARKATAKCNGDYQLFGDSSLLCEAVNGTPTWVGAEEVQCLRVHWSDTDLQLEVPDLDDLCTFPITMGVVTTRFEACVTVIPNENTSLVRLILQGSVNGSEDEVSSPAKVWVSRGRDTVTLAYHTYSVDTGYVYHPGVTVDVPGLLTAGSRAQFCLRLDLNSNTYVLSKDGEDLVSIDVLWWDGVNQLSASCDILQEVTFTYS